MTTTMLQVDGLSVHFALRRSLPDLVLRRPVRYVHAVNAVSFDLSHGESLGLVGESGCGKTTLGRAILGLVPWTDGAVSVDCEDVQQLLRTQPLAFRRRAQMVFQDPFASLNPKLTVRETLSEVLRVHRLCDRDQVDHEISQLLNDVSLSTELAARYPRALSGGQCQRVAIARALALGPSVIVADEPVSSLDVSVQAQILNLFNRLRRERGLAILFISHDLAVVRHVCQRIAVMYLGRIVEIGKADEIFESPRHPYTQALLAAKPKDGRSDLRMAQLPSGEAPSPLRPPQGCAFHPRCSQAMAVCREEPPPRLERHGSVVACHLYDR